MYFLKKTSHMDSTHPLGNSLPDVNSYAIKKTNYLILSGVI
jgi:hypothetical protein